MTAAGWPLDRFVEVTVTPKRWGAAATWTDPLTYTFTGDGSPNALRIGFSVRKHIVATSNPTTVTLYNLRPDTRKALQVPGSRVTVTAGWNYDVLRPQVIFVGGSVYAAHHRQGPDVVTTLSCLSAYGGQAAFSPVQFSQGMELRQVVLYLARTLRNSFPNLQVDPACVKVRSVRIGSQGWTSSGNPWEDLQTLAKEHGFSCTVSNDVFIALDDSLDGNYYLPGVQEISPDNGLLLRAEYSLALTSNLAARQYPNTWQMQPTGMNITSLLVPSVDVGRRVSLISKVDPQMNGTYRVDTLEHRGDTHSTTWETQIDSLYSNRGDWKT